ncbi:hypothetical protein F1880_006730 [Penicillium rolfsii]|nr:hypothetical protein F1880_006730 [Penicillium rolfsii]
MFSSITTRDRLRRSMSTRSMRRARPIREPETVNPEKAKAQAKAAASRAMRSSASWTESNAYDRLGGPSQVAIPSRRPGSSLQQTEENNSVYSASIATPVANRQFTEKNGANRGNALEDSAVLPPITELQGLDGRDSSVPSSYRRLRKAKSMFSTRARSSHVPFGLPSMSPRNACELERSPEIELPRTLRPAISFIGGRRHGNREIRHAKSHDAAIQLARDRFIEEAESPVTHVRRSSFLVRRKRDHRPFRKTFRVSSDTGPDSTPEHVSRWASRSRPRTISSSIKNGLRRVFGLSKPAEQEQSDFGIGEEDLSIATPDNMVVNRPVEGNLGGNMDMDQYFMSSPLSAQSPGGDSLCTSKSRVTSWADSSVANTLKTRKTRHRQSLSLIEEHGDLNKQLPQVPADRTSSQLAVCEGNIDKLNKELNIGGFNTWADSRDLYSALMQQMKGQAVRTYDEDIVFGTVPEYRAIPDHKFSGNSHRSRRTLRHMPSVESSTAGSFATAHVGESTSPQRRQPGPVGYNSGKIPQRMPGQENHRSRDTFLGQVSPHSPCVMGGELDENSGSVVITRLEAATVSPSVYSRTTSGNTPTKGSAGCVATFVGDETGTATIFESQRTTYSSPARTNGSITSSTSVRPSADWQKWISSQIERIEQTSPNRAHLREEAQFADEEDEIFMGMLKRATVPRPETIVESYVSEDNRCNDPVPQAEPQSLVQNNFSRPFSRASSVRTIMLTQKVRPLDPVGNPPDTSEADSFSNPPVLDASPTLACVPSGKMPSLIRLRSTNILAPPESPTPRRHEIESQKRMGTQEPYRRYSARRPIANGKPDQVRSMRSYRASRGINNENTRQQEEHEDVMDDYHKLQDIHSTISSKRMVEMFLDSRRHQVKMELSGSTAAGGAFI